MTKEQLEFIFTYHQPTGDQPQKYTAVNEAFLECAIKVDGLMPDGAGKTAAIRKLADARMAVNAAISLEGRF